MFYNKKKNWTSVIALQKNFKFNINLLVLFEKNVFKGKLPLKTFFLFFNLIII